MHLRSGQNTKHNDPIFLRSECVTTSIGFVHLGFLETRLESRLAAVALAAALASAIAFAVVGVLLFIAVGCCHYLWLLLDFVTAC